MEGESRRLLTWSMDYEKWDDAVKISIDFQNRCHYYVKVMRFVMYNTSVSLPANHGEVFMDFTKHYRLFLCAILAFSSFVTAGPAKKKIEGTDPALRLKWHRQHQALKADTPYKEMHWRHIGPFDVGGRCVDVDVSKGSRLVMYVAAATGGLWKTDNAGISWTPLIDDLPSLSVGDIAVSESHPDTIYLGTGEANHFRASIAGTGVYKSV
jgi:hypothetical protein